MKRHILYALLSIFNCHSIVNTIEEKFPSLAELAGKKAEIESPNFEKLTLDAQQQILTKKGTIDQILRYIPKFVEAKYIKEADELAQTIPAKLWNDLITPNTTIRSFESYVFNELSPEKQKLIIDALYEKVLSFIEKDTLHIAKLDIQSGWFGTTQIFGKYELPIDFTTFFDETINKNKAITWIPIIKSFGYLMILYIGQQIEMTVLNNLENKYNKILIDPFIESKLRGLLLPQLVSFSEEYEQKYHILGDYISRLKKVLNQFFDSKVTKVTYNTYVRDQDTGEYVEQ